MFVRKAYWFIAAMVTLVLVAICAPKFSHAIAAASDWFAPVTPAINKTQDYPASQPPLLSNMDCMPVTVASNERCAIDSSIGTVLTNGQIKVDNSAYTLLGYNGFGTVQPVPNSPLYLTTQPGAVTGQFIAFHRSLARSDMKEMLVDHVTFVSKQYQITKNFDYWLTDSNHNKLPVNTGAMAFSSNGNWMVFDVPRVGLFRANMATMDLTLVGPSPEQTWFLGTYNESIAVSDDGTYAVLGDSSSLNLYTIGSCKQQGYGGGAVSFDGCKYRDMWQGQKALTGSTEDMGLKSQIANGSVLGNLRFIDDENIAFDARYDYVSSSNYKVAEFVVTAYGGSLHKSGLLALGDSYISGEGEFDYIGGTDDLATNMCHLSQKSYPYLVGKKYTEDYHSVACSGAKTLDVQGNDKGYNGQFGSAKNLDEAKENLILSLFNPGYIHQNSFAQTYQPQTILLSIGGNNVGFSSILQNCIVKTADGGTCYASYEDRYELMQSINDSFDDLVATYGAIHKASPDSRIYVVGYPQIVKPDGDCGANVHLNKQETEFASQLVTYLDTVVRRAADKSGVYYVDTEEAFDGHRLCEASGNTAAMNGLTAGKDIPLYKTWLRLIGKETYHPTVFGHELLASTVETRTQNLSTKMPIPQPGLAKPGIDTNNPFLLSAPKDNRKIYKLENDETIADDIVQMGVATAVNIDGLLHNTQLSGIYNLVLHSDPVTLGTFHSDANGDIHGSFTVPNSVPTGIHTLNIYGKDMSGNDIDIQKQIYVVNGDGPEFGGMCGVVADSGEDIDKDGTDDACDSTVGPAPSSNSIPESSASDKTEGTVLGATTKDGPSQLTGISLPRAVSPQFTVATQKIADVELSQPHNEISDTGPVQNSNKSTDHALTEQPNPVIAKTGTFRNHLTSSFMHVMYAFIVVCLATWFILRSVTRRR